MPSDTPAPEPAAPEFGTRNARGEWRPPYPVRNAPLFSWPVRVAAILKWTFGYPGFLWPTNLLLLAISAASWYLTQPAVPRCASFEAGWILQVYVRNLAMMWLYYGGFHLYLYILKGEGKFKKYDPNWPARNSRIFLFGDQVYDNIFWTCGVAGLVWTAYEVVAMWLYANHYVPWLQWARHPVVFVAWFFVIPLWREFHFYWVHRLIHWKPLYKHVHYLHHKNVNPNAWSGMAMHPVETILYLSVAAIHWVVPSHPFHFLFDLQHAALGPAGGHHGYEGPILKGKFPTGSYFHYLHHRYFECNYGETTVPMDKWFGTFRDGLPDGAGATLPGEHKA
jgi:sterol desaturase/sphingolipid hydroxylase (fatty acid hydroxylase superfamily)